MTRMQQFSLIACLILSTSGAFAAEYDKKPSDTQFETPSWFKSSFLDLKEDIASAAAENKRLLVYIGQDGCPYCKELMQNNFAQKDIVDFTRKHFDVLALNMWGDGEVVDTRGKSMTEKQLAEALDIKYTPTLLFFDEQGQIALRINGYFPPHQMRAALRYVAEKREKQEDFRTYYARVSPPAASGKLHANPAFVKPPYDFSKSGGKPLVVFFEQKQCSDCDRLHREVMTRKETAAQLKRFKAAQFDMWAQTPVTTPDGTKTTARDWAQKLNIAYAPSAVLFDANGKEILRIEALLKAFHVQSALDYVASGAYRRQPSLQRFIDERASEMRARGEKVDIWK